MNSITYPSSVVPSPPFISPSPSLSSPTTSGFSWKNPWFLVTVLLILALLGINVFSILAKGTDQVSTILHPIWNFFSRILKFFGFSTLETVKQTTQTSATGVSTIADTVATGTATAVDAVESKAGGSQETVPPSGGQTSPTSAVATAQQSTLQTALNSASDAAIQNEGVEPDDSYSTIQGGGKAGWCFVGEQQGIRSCVQVGVNDKCMSGDVFPTQDVCVNPKLRVG